MSPVHYISNMLDCRSFSGGVFYQWSVQVLIYRTVDVEISHLVHLGPIQTSFVKGCGRIIGTCIKRYFGTKPFSFETVLMERGLVILKSLDCLHSCLLSTVRTFTFLLAEAAALT